MAKNAKEILKFLFPEYQIKVAIDEHGFIAKSENNVREKEISEQIIRQNNVQQITTPSYSPVQTPLPKVNSSSCTSGISKTSTKAYAPIKEDSKLVSKADDAFEGLDDALKEYWVGSKNDCISICKAFKRPYVKGFDNKKPKNTILIIGEESRGKIYSIKCISDLLKKKKIFRYSEVAVMNLIDYTADTSNGLFLSDLYKVLNSNTETVAFENIDKATLPQLDIIYQLIVEGSYKLSKRYMVNNGSLIEATGVLNTELISDIVSNGKFFVLTTTVAQEKIVSILGNKIVKELGDVIVLDSINEEQVKDLAYTLCINMAGKCRNNLHIKVEFDDSLVNELAKHYRVNQGVKALADYIDDNLYETLAEMKLQEKLWDDEKARLTYDNGYCVLLMGGEIIRVSDYKKNFNSMELEDARKELNQVIGLSGVKEYVLNLENNYKVQQMREGKGLKKSDVSMHMIFVGNPGTGKTTIARIVAKYLKAIGVLSSGHLCEVTRADLVGQYAGHTAVKTTDVIKSAIGGVLFIDEAYSLCRGKEDIFGLEAIDALVKGMEDNRDDLVVILAGYNDEIQEFLKSNSGLKSRFPNIVQFEDYTINEMLQIANVTANAKGYKISTTCTEGLQRIFEKHQIKGKNDSGNGRLVRNIIEEAILNQSQRIIKNPEDDIELLIPSDFGLDKTVEFDLEKELSKIIGLDNVKDFVRTQYKMCLAREKRLKADIDVDTSQALNMIFSGNPGTGKTTIARVVADMFKSMGILKSGQLIETDKTGLIAEYVGQTAKKTEDVFKSALGGVLFIDEAYSITNDGGSFGQECIDTLVKLIEDYKGEIIVILAGYTREMHDFLKGNSGLESRFPLRIDFPDYTEGELFKIGKQMINTRGFSITQEAEKVFEEEIINLKKHSTQSSGNGRMVRNYIEDIIRRQSSRIAEEDITGVDLTQIIPEDIKSLNNVSNEYDLEKELSKVIGLESVKKYIRSLNARLLMQTERKRAGLKTDSTQTMHMIFAGNPGTGKTMMARTVADVLYHMNVIQSNKLIETDRSGLVAGYVGQTAIKTRQVIETALGGVLFIDEAYSLAQGGENDFGQEAIDTLVKMMDDNRDRLVVILAGYTEDMNHFLSKNAGLQSRFANIIEFPDYNTDELLQIADNMYSEQGYTLNNEAKAVLREKLDVARQNKQFGNGRYVRNVFERSLNNQALRLSTDTNLTKEELVTITKDDLQEA